MSRETIRRVITLFLMALVAAIAIRAGEGKYVALTLTPIAALFVPVLRFYFPPKREARARDANK